MKTHQHACSGKWPFSSDVCTESFSNQEFSEK
jgi:hypothetical protein